jgi:DNA polymerase-3 subunit epsilon
MTIYGWIIFIVTATVQLVVVFGTVWFAWTSLGSEDQALFKSVWDTSAGIIIVAAFALVGLVAAAVSTLSRLYVIPLSRMDEEIRLIAMTNPNHRLAGSGGPEVRHLAETVNSFADRYQALINEVEERIREANAAVEEEKNTLATLMAKLVQGVLVCNPEGRILLYNQRAQLLLEGPTSRSGAADWIGLGRSIYGVFEEGLISHALTSIDHRLQQGETAIMVPFVAPRADGQMLSVHVVPILDADRSQRGFIMTLEDITRRVGTDTRRGTLLHALTEGQRSSIAGIRAAIETVLYYPEMDPEPRVQFLKAIRDDALKISLQLEQLAKQYAGDLEVHWPLDNILGSDLLAAIERSVRDAKGVELAVTAPLEPLWLKADSYAIVQALSFVIERLLNICRAHNLALSLERNRELAAMILEWDGAPLDMEALRSWGMRNVMTDRQGTSSTLFEVIERHGGAIWSDRETPSGRPRVRVILPVSRGDQLAAAAAEDDARHDFDFKLFGQSLRQRSFDDLPLNKVIFTVVDTETTGLDPDAGDEIIAIGAVRIVNGRILKKEIFDSLINPRRSISEQSRSVHGITSAMLRAMPTIDEVLPRFHRFVEDTVIVGHNVAFDMRFLKRKEKDTGIRFENPVLDTLLLEHIVHPNQEAKSLEAIAARFGITVKGRHTALGDALTTAEVFLAQVPLLEERGVTTLKHAIVACETSPYAKMMG